MSQIERVPSIIEHKHSVTEVASALRRWCVAHRLQDELPSAVESDILEGDLVVNISIEAEAILRNRGVESISLNQIDRTIAIYTKRKVTKAELKVLPGYLSGCSVLYPQGVIDDIGECRSQAQITPAKVFRNSSGNYLYACGSSISPGNDASAGTLGCLVSDKQGVMYGLTNNHVTGGCSHSPVGLPILAPGVIDVGVGQVNPFTLGHHYKVLEYVTGSIDNANVLNNSDAALFKIQDSNKVTSYQWDRYDTPKTAIDPEEKMVVEKVGRTTGHTKGKIVGRTLMPILVTATAGNYSFKAKVSFFNIFIIHGTIDVFSAGGDSGSLVTTINSDGSRSGVGLIFAGGGDSLAPGGQMSLMLPLKPILDKFNVDLVSDHNV